MAQCGRSPRSEGSRRDFQGRCRAPGVRVGLEMMLFSVELRSVPAQHSAGAAIYYTRAHYSAPYIAPPLRVFDGAAGVSTLLIQAMAWHVLDPRACRAPLRVSLTHRQGAHCGI